MKDGRTADVDLKIDHALGRTAAVSRLKQLLKSPMPGNAIVRDAAFDHGDKVLSFSARVKGAGVKGQVMVLDDVIQVLVWLPWAARPFRAAAADHMREYIQKSLL